MPNGEYEVEIFLLTLNASPRGAEFLDFNLLIRSDVPQPQQGTHVHVPLWRNQKNNSYDLNMMTVIAEACGIPDNLVFANLDEVIRAFQGRYVRVKLITKRHLYHDKWYSNIDVVKWLPTEYPKGEN
ncbi:DUF669 domain-containing protein [uncultured Limosilactobacillus sp.]|uniref:DUF669 domain-containing protein n=1 Tax=Limosilactobacillus urinaemulieris TaxID=2742600 RepID=UPI0026F39FE0|nr:DUF669 domain-containing protein [uncultured Limosilactobacillus sp.]